MRVLSELVVLVIRTVKYSKAYNPSMGYRAFEGSVVDGGVDVLHQIIQRFLVGLVGGKVAVDVPGSLLDLIETGLVLVSLTGGADSDNGHNKSESGKEDHGDEVEHGSSFQRGLIFLISNCVDFVYTKPITRVRGYRVRVSEC